MRASRHDRSSSLKLRPKPALPTRVTVLRIAAAFGLQGERRRIVARERPHEACRQHGACDRLDLAASRLALGRADLQRLHLIIDGQRDLGEGTRQAALGGARADFAVGQGVGVSGAAAGDVDVEGVFCKEFSLTNVAKCAASAVIMPEATINCRQRSAQASAGPSVRDTNRTCGVVDPAADAQFVVVPAIPPTNKPAPATAPRTAPPNTVVCIHLQMKPATDMLPRRVLR